MTEAEMVQPGDVVWFRGGRGGPYLVAGVRGPERAWITHADGRRVEGWQVALDAQGAVSRACLTTEPPPPPPESPWTPRAVCLAAALTCMAFSAAGLALHALGALLR